MTQIVDYPIMVEGFTDWSSKDLSYHQMRRFKQYLTGLMGQGQVKNR